MNAIKLPVVVVGLGLSGKAALKLLKARGIADSDIKTFDDNDPTAQYSDSEKLLADLQPQTLIVSPGVPLKTKWIAELQAQGVTITSELALAVEHLKDEKIICITGSLGKSTTVTLLAEGLKSFSKSYFLGGNIGVPLAQYAAELEEGSRLRADWLILELSSYQLENCGALKSDLSGITYLSSNHLDRYTSKDQYYQTKWSLFERTRKNCVINSNGGDLPYWAKSHKVKAPLTEVSSSSSFLGKDRLSRSQMVGQHNRDNIALAAELAKLADWPPQAYEALLNFKGLPHRMENLGEFRGIRFINDSKATTMESVLTAVEACENSYAPRSLWLLLGGRDKKLPWNQLSELSSFSNLELVFFGECRAEAQMYSRLKGHQCTSLADTLPFIKGWVKSGDLV